MYSGSVPTRHLYGDEPCSDLAHARTPVLLDGSPRYVQGGDLGYELERNSAFSQYSLIIGMTSASAKALTLSRIIRSSSE